MINGLWLNASCQQYFPGDEYVDYIGHDVYTTRSVWANRSYWWTIKLFKLLRLL